MELVAPAGSLKKLATAYDFGADAAYIGLDGLSLRARTEACTVDDAEALKALKGNRKLYCAVNIYFRDRDIRLLEGIADRLGEMPFDAFIVSDPGAIRLLKSRFGEVELHLSTQANCTNAEAARFWRDAGCSRVIPGRELSLEEIATMKAAVPEMGIEVFAHGAICLAYSGRCFLSAWMAGRSGNDGSCAQSCRWSYRVLEEAERPGQYYPVLENEGFTTILSSKDLSMIDHLAELKAAGVDSIKIEGRMKSLYYLSAVVRAYRAGIDRANGLDSPGFEEFRKDLETVSHREYCTGFYFGRGEIERSTESGYTGESLFLGTVETVLNPGIFLVDVRNHIEPSYRIETLIPGIGNMTLETFSISGEYGETLASADFGKHCLLRTDAPLRSGTILRRRVAVLPTSGYTRDTEVPDEA